MTACPNVSVPCIKGWPPSRNDAGFTLLEVLVALALFVMVSVGLYRGLALGWRGLAAAGSAEGALAVAEERLAAAGVEQPLVAGEQSGVAEGGIAWTAAVTPYSAPGEPGPPAAALSPFWVEVTVTWREAPGRPWRTLVLKTLKLASGP